MIAALLNTTNDGARIRLSSCGLRFASWSVPVQRGEKPTEAAERSLAEHGWQMTEPWQSPPGIGWVAYVQQAEGE